MRSTLRKTSNSSGVLIPASFLTASDIEGEIHFEDCRIVIEPVSTSHEGWFDNFQPEQNVEA